MDLTALVLLQAVAAALPPSLFHPTLLSEPPCPCRWMKERRQNCLFDETKRVVIFRMVLKLNG